MRLTSIAVCATAVTAWVAASAAVSCTTAHGAHSADETIEVLFFGNSHTDLHDVPTLVAELIESVDPSVEVIAVRGTGYQFLDERLDHEPSLDLLESRRWDYVVLQAQKYSASGTRRYSTAEAQEWIRLVRVNGAVPILFPEWPRRGYDETDRIFELHDRIAIDEAACVAPVPQAFDVAAASEPDLDLHANDGNHSSPAGALLAATVLAHTISGSPIGEFEDLATVEVSAPDQSALRSAAQQAVAVTDPWRRCPLDQPRPACGTHSSPCEGQPLAPRRWNVRYIRLW